MRTYLPIISRNCPLVNYLQWGTMRYIGREGQRAEDAAAAIKCKGWEAVGCNLGLIQSGVQ